MKTLFNRFNPFRKPSPIDVMEKMAYDASINLLAQEAAASYHRKLAEYHAENLARIQKRMGHVVTPELQQSILH